MYKSSERAMQSRGEERRGEEEGGKKRMNLLGKSAALFGAALFV